MTPSNGNISALLALCEGKPPVTGGFPSQRPVTQNVDVFFDLRLKNRNVGDLRRSLWRHSDAHYDVANANSVATTTDTSNHLTVNKLLSVAIEACHE